MQQVFQDPDALRHKLAMPGFQRFGSASALPDLSFGGAAAVAVKTEQGQPSLSRSSTLVRRAAGGGYNAQLLGRRRLAGRRRRRGAAGEAEPVALERAGARRRRAQAA